MQLTTVVRDCLYLNWAVPVRALPRPPRPLRYDTVSEENGEYAFVTALLFRQRGLKLAAAPLVGASYPQFNLRINTRSSAGLPSVLFRAMLVPPWVSPAVRWVGRQPARSAMFRYPKDVSRDDASSWEWRVRWKGIRFAVRATPSSPGSGDGPSVGNWEETVNFFRLRPLGYSIVHGRLHAIQTTHPRIACWPVSAEIDNMDLLERLLPLDGMTTWPELHSAWLCPEIPFTFELLGERMRSVAQQAPAAG